MEQANEIKLKQVDEQLSIVINGQNLSELFSGYKIMQVSSQESEIWLRVKGQCTIAELSTIAE